MHIKCSYKPEQLFLQTMNDYIEEIIELTTQLVVSQFDDCTRKFTRDCKNSRFCPCSILHKSNKLQN